MAMRNGECKTIIVNSDDFGLSENVTIEISNLFYPKGIVTSTTIMANTDHLARIKSIVDQNPQISFGIHLNITEGPSLTKNKIFAKYRLIDKDGNFIKAICKRIEYQNCEAELLNAIYEEWKMQMDTLIEVGIIPDHIDGHHHCHTWYALSKIAIRIAEEYRINLIRNVISHRRKTFKDILLSSIGETFLFWGLDICKLRGKKYVNNRVFKMFDVYQSRSILQKLFKSYKILSTDLFCDYDDFKLFADSKNYSTIELMCHPGHPKCVQQTKRIAEDSYLLKNSRVVTLTNYKGLLS